MTGEHIMTMAVRAFAMGTNKEAALKPLEEAAEVYAEWQDLEFCLAHMPHCNGCEVDGGTGGCAVKTAIADEIADCIQACCNLAARYRLDLAAAMGRCEERNVLRGRYER